MIGSSTNTSNNGESLLSVKNCVSFLLIFLNHTHFTDEKTTALRLSNPPMLTQSKQDFRF